MADIAVLSAQLELQTAAFTAGVKQVDRRLKGMDQNFKKTNKSILGMEKGLAKMKTGLGAIAGAMAAAFSVQSVKNAIAFGDQMAKNAGTLGLSVEAFQEFGYAAERAGIASSQFTSNMTAFVKRVGEAKAGVGPLVSGLQVLDGELLKSIQSAKNQDEAFRLVIKAMGEAATATDRARIANAAFSRSGVAMGRMAEDFETVVQQAREFGVVMEEGTARQAEVLTDKMATLSTVIGVQFKSSLIEFVSANSEAMAAMVDMGQALGLTFSGAFKAVTAAVGGIIGVITKLAAEAVAAFTALGRGIGAGVGYLIDGAKRLYLEAQIASKQFVLGILEGYNSVVATNNNAAKKLLSFFGLGETDTSDLSAEIASMREQSVALGAAMAAGMSAGLSGKEDNPVFAALNEVSDILIRQAQENGAEAGATFARAFEVASGDGLGSTINGALEAKGAIDGLAESMTGDAVGGADAITKAMLAQAEAVKRAVDPMYVYQSEIAKLNTLRKADLITTQQWADAIQGASDTYAEAVAGMASSTTELQSLSEGMLEGFTTSFDSMVDGIARGTQSLKDGFKDLVKSLIAQFLKLMAYKGIGALLGIDLTSNVAHGKAPIKNAKGNIFAGGNLVPFAKGGVTNIPTMFAMNNGKTGIMGEAGPEAIMPLKRGSNGELGVNAVQPIVNVNNNAPVSVSTSARADGTVDIEIIERVIESSIRRGGNAISGAIESTYGVGRANGAFGY